MKAIVIVLSIFFFFQENFPQVLSRYEDDSKAILIFAPDNQSRPYDQSISILTRDPLGIDSRNIKIFEIFIAGGIGPGGESFSEEEVISIRKHYDIDPSNFNIILSLKNFEEIYRSDKPIEIDEIFQKFDQLE